MMRAHDDMHSCLAMSRKTHTWRVDPSELVLRCSWFSQVLV